MPTYEYGCRACGHEFEREQRITEPAIKTCPNCGKDEAQRLITQGNFILKGGGWYSDLYSGPSNEKKEKSSSGKTETKTESSDSTTAKETKSASSSGSTDTVSTTSSATSSSDTSSSTKPAKKSSSE